MDPTRNNQSRVSAPNSELNSPRASTNYKRIGEESPRKREEEKNALTINAVRRPNTPSMSGSLIVDQIGKHHHTESRSSSVPRSMNEPSFMRETFSNLQKFTNGVRANSPITPRMKFGIVDYSKSRPHNSPVVQVKPPTQKANVERIDTEVVSKTIQDLSIVIGLGVCCLKFVSYIFIYYFRLSLFQTIN